MVKRNWFKVSALFIVLTFVMSLAPSMCFAEGDAAASSNVVFQIWQDTPLSEIDPNETNIPATFAGKATQEGGIKFLNRSTTTADYHAKDGVNAAAILHGDYNKSTPTPSLTKTYYVDFGADISGLVTQNGYDRTFVSFDFCTLNDEKIDLSGFKIGAYKKAEDGSKELYPSVSLGKYVHIIKGKWALLEFSMKDLGLDGIDNNAFEGLYFETKIKENLKDPFYSSVGKFDNLNIVNSVGSGTMNFANPPKYVEPELTFVKAGASGSELEYCRIDTNYFTNPNNLSDISVAKKQEMLALTYDTKEASDTYKKINLNIMSKGKENPTSRYIYISPITTVAKGNTLTTIKSHYETTNTDLVFKIKKGLKYNDVVKGNGNIFVGVGQMINTTGKDWDKSPLKMGLVALDSAVIENDAASDYVQIRISLTDFIEASKYESTLLNEKNENNSIGELTLDNINVFGFVYKNYNISKIQNNAKLLEIDEIGLAPHTEAVENKMVYGGSQQWAMPAGAAEPLCYTLTSSGNNPERLYDTTNTERKDYGTTNKIIYTWAYWGNDVYTPECTKIGIAFNQPQLDETDNSKIKFSMNNYTTSPVTPALVIAYYNGEELVDVQLVTNTTFAFGGPKSSTVEMSTEKEYTSYKAFMLDTIENIIPLAKSFENGNSAA